MIRPTEQDDIDMMRNPDRWPVWPLLPLKRFTHEGGLFDNCAVVLESLIDGTLMLFEGQNIFQFDATKPHEVVTPEEVSRRGWRVD